MLSSLSGKAEEVFTPQERMVGAITLVAVLLVLVVIIFYAITVSNYPNIIPLHEEDRQLREILFATNRKMSNPIDLRNISDERSQNLTYGAAVVRIPEKHNIGNVERPNQQMFLWLVPIGQEQENEKAHFVIRNIQALTFSEILSATEP
jgi:hypothetical protein